VEEAVELGEGSGLGEALDDGVEVPGAPGLVPMYEYWLLFIPAEKEDALSQMDSTATTDLLACPERTFPLKVLLSE
jgi:hypothetical protein